MGLMRQIVKYRFSYYTWGRISQFEQIYGHENKLFKDHVTTNAEFTYTVWCFNKYILKGINKN